LAVKYESDFLRDSSLGFGRAGARVQPSD